MERLHAGWLVKSPPGKKTVGPWRLFKSKWRERYFVLYAPPSSQTIPGCCSAVLCYYDDEKLVKEYGRIDLSCCEEILTQLESDEHHHIFALRTVNKDNERTYYLAANSNEEMNQWANCLCCVLRLSGGDGINMSSGFDHLSAFDENLGPSRCPVLTQRTGEQRRMANFPPTISKSANAFNIRMAEATPPNSTPNPKPDNERKGKRQSILNMVVKPAVNTLWRPSSPAVNAAQSKFHTVGRKGGLQLTNGSFPNNASAPLHDFHQQRLTLGRSVPKLNFLPPTPVALYGTSSKGPDFAAGGSNEHDNRLRFGDATASSVAVLDNNSLQCPPLLPSRVLRNPSSVQTKDTTQLRQNLYRNSSDGFQWAKTRPRRSDPVDEDSDEGSFDQDYVLPRPIHDTDGGSSNCQEGVEYREQQAEASEEDRDDDYSYPPSHYNLGSPTDEFLASPSLSTRDGEGEGCEDSYDYLPSCSSRAPSDRMSITRSSTHTNSSVSSSNQEGVYDILPLRNYGSEEETSSSRMSGIESTDKGVVYQNDVFRRPSSDIYDYPNPREITTDDQTLGILPPLPAKKGCKGETPREKKPVPLPPSPPRRDAQASADGHCYVNNVDVMKSRKESSQSSDDDDVYLPMNKGGTKDSIYTPMHSPEAHRVVVKRSADRRGCNDDAVDDSSSLPRDSQFAGNETNDLNPPSAALIPIRFTANTRSFKKKVPNRETLDTKVEISTTSLKQKENLEPSRAVYAAAPPLPPKKIDCRNPNYIHYASLNLVSTADKLPPSPPTSPGGRSSQTEDTLYRQIDPEKTKALCELKRQMDDRQRNFAKFASEH